nr:5013_t:CDS:2 [Entrophospora candida]
MNINDENRNSKTNLFDDYDDINNVDNEDQRSFFNTDDIKGDNDLCDDSIIGNNVSESGGDNSHYSGSNDDKNIGH